MKENRKENKKKKLKPNGGEKKRKRKEENREYVMAGRKKTEIRWITSAATESYDAGLYNIPVYSV